MQDECKAPVIMLILRGFSLCNQRQTSFMAPLPGIEKIELINILTKEGNATLDIFLKFCKRKNKNSFTSSGCTSY